MAKNEDLETLVAVQNGRGEETFRFLELGDYDIKVVNVRNPRQFVIMTWWDVPRFVQAFAELEDLNRF